MDISTGENQENRGIGYTAGTILYFGWFDQIDDARQYIKENGLTEHDVKLLRNRDDDSLTVVAKRSVYL